jgi:hypothetical protein
MDADLETSQEEDSWTEETRGLPSLVKKMRVLDDVGLQGA